MSYFCMVLNTYFFTQKTSNFWVVIEDVEPYVLSHVKAVYICAASPDEQCFHIFTTIIGTDQASFLLSEYESWFSSNLKTNINYSRLYEYNLRYFIEFSIKNSASLFNSWFQILQYFNHEVSVQLIIPTKEVMVSFNVWDLENKTKII